MKPGKVYHRYLRSDFNKLGKIGNIVINNFTMWKHPATKYYLPWGLNLGPLPFQFDAYPTELTWLLLVCLDPHANIAYLSSLR